MKRAFTIALGLCVLSFGAPVRGQQAPTMDLAGAWAELTTDDDARLAKALLALAKSPKEGFAFLKEHLRPVKADAKDVHAWIGQLDDANFRVRGKAQGQLEYLGKYVQKDLEASLKGELGAEAKRRVQQLLDRIGQQEKEKKKAEAAPLIPAGGRSISVSNVNGQIQITVDGKPLDLTPRVIMPIVPPGPWVRAARAVGILEHWGTPEAKQLLEALAQGEAEALPTVKAKEALARMKQ